MVGTGGTHRDEVRSSKVSYDPGTGAYSHVANEGDNPPAVENRPLSVCRQQWCHALLYNVSIVPPAVEYRPLSVCSAEATAYDDNDVMMTI